MATTTGYEDGWTTDFIAQAEDLTWWTDLLCEAPDVTLTHSYTNTTPSHTTAGSNSALPSSSTRSGMHDSTSAYDNFVSLPSEHGLGFDEGWMDLPIDNSRPGEPSFSNVDGAEAYHIDANIVSVNNGLFRDQDHSILIRQLADIQGLDPPAVAASSISTLRRSNERIWQPSSTIPFSVLPNDPLTGMNAILQYHPNQPESLPSSSAHHSSSAESSSVDIDDSGANIGADFDKFMENVLADGQWPQLPVGPHIESLPRSASSTLPVNANPFVQPYYNAGTEGRSELSGPIVSTTSTPETLTSTTTQIGTPDDGTIRVGSSLFLTDDERWEATLRRDLRADGCFLYCVLTTLIFCRPGCPSRRPARSNVVFVTTADEARARGCRSCKRCLPDDESDPTEKRQMDAVERLQRALLGEDDTDTGGRNDPTAARQKVTVKKVAEDMGISMWHLNRLFKRKVGCPPQTWARERAAEASKAARIE